MKPTPCVICGAELQTIDEDATNQPYQGTTFWTGGHYGSTVFDPMDENRLEVNFCDECLVQLASEGKVLWGRNKERNLVPWDPDLETTTIAKDIKEEEPV